MAESDKEIVVAGDCQCEGEAFLRGETRTVSKEVYRQLVAAGRVCMDELAAEGAKADLERRRVAEKPPKGAKSAKGGEGDLA